MCGEKGLTFHQMLRPTGSPPRVRGKVADSRKTPNCPRITPACAGKSFFTVQPPQTRQDHPRVCGEKALLGVVNVFAEGSPPRVRGKGRRAIRALSVRGITPACAGKRPGDYIGYRLAAGSPPRVRGKAMRVVQSSRCRRITPACAGKSCTKRLPMRQGKDHPRVCGEKEQMDFNESMNMGSPPRVRGKD